MSFQQDKYTVTEKEPDSTRMHVTLLPKVVYFMTVWE